MKKPELLIPAGSLEVLKTAVNFGADAVYIGGEAFGLRAKAKNFSPEDMAEGIAYAHDRGVKVYVTANILAHNGDLEAASDYFMELKHLKTKDGRPVPPDALIISDPGLFMIAKRVCPEIELHISTQANSTNYETWLFWWNLGAKRVVSARELSLAELKKIRSHIPSDMEIESFVHGAMCISYSGRCLLSNYFTGRDANRGACTHPCRWKYAVMEESRPGEYLPVYENERGTFIFNSKDLCMLEHIPDLLDAGIDSFKIEGRMRQRCMWRRWRGHIGKRLMTVWNPKKNTAPIWTGTTAKFHAVPIDSLRRAFITESRMKNLRFMILIPIKAMQFIWALFTRRIIRAVQESNSAINSAWAM